MPTDRPAAPADALEGGFVTIQVEARDLLGTATFTFMPARTLRIGR